MTWPWIDGAGQFAILFNKTNDMLFWLLILMLGTAFVRGFQVFPIRQVGLINWNLQKCIHHLWIKVRSR